MSNGQVLVDLELEKLVAEGSIRGEPPVESDQVQPNSLDLRVGNVARVVHASFVPVEQTVSEALSDGLQYHTIDLSSPDGGVLQKGLIYLVPLLETFHLPSDVAGKVNPKSSTGRLDIFCRAVADRAPAFDHIIPGYDGPLYLEIVPQSFHIRLRTGDRLSQVRLFTGDPVLTNEEIREELGHHLVVSSAPGRPLPPEKVVVREGGVHFGVNLGGRRDQMLGYLAKEEVDAPPIDLREIGSHSVRSYWEPVWRRGSPHVILKHAKFYIFASREFISLGPTLCAEMLPYDAGMGEVRSHYAGFFDSGFGWPTELASRIVLEVRNHHVPYRLFDGQTLFKVKVMRNSQQPRNIYGAGRLSNYQGQGLRLAKQFPGPKASGLQDELLSLDEQRQTSLFSDT